MALTRDMYALASYLMRSSNVGAFNTIAELDLSFTQIKALCALDMDGEDRSVKALADSHGVSLPAMSRAVDGLYERGFVGPPGGPGRPAHEARAPDRRRPHDARSSLNEARLSTHAGV